MMYLVYCEYTEEFDGAENMEEAVHMAQNMIKNAMDGNETDRDITALIAKTSHVVKGRVSVVFDMDVAKQTEVTNENLQDKE